LNVLSRSVLIDKHTTSFSKELFETVGDQLIVVVDGTYVFIQKSGNYSFQKMSYSMHKGRHLLKMMMIVTTSGRIVECYGPYLSNGKNNDASILENIFVKQASLFRAFFNEKDLFIVDRGFRDVLEFLHKLSFQTKMPFFLTKGKTFEIVILQSNEINLF
jgi:hypothetical protein